MFAHQPAVSASAMVDFHHLAASRHFGEMGVAWAPSGSDVRSKYARFGSSGPTTAHLTDGMLLEAHLVSRVTLW
jgi:hypothetical protein